MTEKSIVYSSCFVPMEIIAAHGLVPRRNIVSAPVSPEGLHEGECSYAHGFRNFSPEENTAGVITVTVCDQMRRGAERFSSGLPVFLLTVPSTCRTDSAIKLYQYELERLSDWLSQFSGSDPDVSVLTDTMKKIDHVRRRIREKRNKMSAVSFTRMLAVFNGFDNLELSRFTPEPPGSGVPLALLGGPFSSEDFRIFELFSGAGGEIVYDGTETGERTLPAPFEFNGSPMRELTLAYLAIPDISQRPNSNFYRELEKIIKQRKIRGIVIRRYSWCDLWHAEVQRIVNFTGLPVLDLDVEAHQPAGISRSVTRIEAFMETLT